MSPETPNEAPAEEQSEPRKTVKAGPAPMRTCTLATDGTNLHLFNCTMTPIELEVAAAYLTKYIANVRAQHKTPPPQPNSTDGAAEDPPAEG